MPTIDIEHATRVFKAHGFWLQYNPDTHWAAVTLVGRCRTKLFDLNRRDDRINLMTMQRVVEQRARRCGKCKLACAAGGAQLKDCQVI